MTVTQVALVQVCVDERLNHDLLRVHVKHKLAELDMQAQRILILNEVGGNLGNNFANALQMFVSAKAQIVFAAVLHHDDCKAAQAGLRQSLTETITRMKTVLAKYSVTCIVASGSINSSTNDVLWYDLHHVEATS